MQAYIGIVLGQRGAGKSTMLFRELVPLAIAPVFILDTLGGDVDFGIHFHSVSDLAEYFCYEENYSGVFVLKSTSDEESKAFFRFVETVGIEMSEEGGEGITMVVDEIDKFCTSHNIDPTINRMIRYGRRHGINCLFASRRTSEINSTIRAQADFFISLRQTEPNDVKTLAARSSKGAEVVKELSLFRDTGEHSEYIIIGDIPADFVSLQETEYHILF